LNSVQRIQNFFLLLGGWECLRAAVANGADAVYFGPPRFNARIRADNFTEEELPEVIAFCYHHGHFDYAGLKKGDRIWKIDDPELGKRLRQSYAGRIESHHQL
jgi:putative protease